MTRPWLISRRNILQVALSSVALASTGLTPARAQAPLQKATLRLNYVPNAEHAPYYLGLKKGFFREVGLDLEILAPEYSQ